MLIKLLYYILGFFFFLSPFLLCYTIFVLLKFINKDINKKIRIIIASILFLISIGLLYMLKDTGIESIKIANNTEISEDNKFLIKINNTPPVWEGDMEHEDKKENEKKFKIKKGIDVSKYQGKINWKLVSNDNIDFAIIRLGYRGYETGKLNIDDFFKKNIKNALKNDLNVGVYFSSTAITKKEIEEEVDLLIKNVKRYNITLPLALAWGQEKSPDSRTASVSKKDAKKLFNYYCKLIVNTGYNPIVYIDEEWLDDFKYDFKYPLWIGIYNKNKKPDINELKIWQYTNSGNVLGITGKVDLNYYYIN